MIFIADAQGSITQIGTTSIYQGSVKAGQIILLAPLPASLSVVVGFTLPNGKHTSINLASPNDRIRMTPIDLDGIISTEEQNNYNAWIYTLQAEITEFPGTVTVQFFCYTPTSEVLTTYSAEFEVQQGVAVQLPSTPQDNIYRQILSALAENNAKINALKNEEVIIRVNSLPERDINPQAIYIVKSENLSNQLPKVYVYNNSTSSWQRLDNVIVPISTNSESDSTSGKFFLMSHSGRYVLYAYIGTYKRILDETDYTELSDSIETANTNASSALEKATQAETNVVIANASANQANQTAENANTNANNAKSVANTANSTANTAITTANEALSKAIEALNASLKVLEFKGSVPFSALPTPSANNLNDMYNVSDAFITTSDFVEGAGKSYPANTNVIVVNSGSDYKYDVLAGFIDLSPYQLKLVSGENIKTVNGESILGNGDLVIQGEQGVGIANVISGSPSVGTDYTTTPITVTYTDNTTKDFIVYAKNGKNGANGTNGTNGVGILNIQKTSTSGLTDTYTITYTNGSTSTFTVTNGAQGQVGAQGVGISGVVANTPTQGSGEYAGYTATPLRVTLSNQQYQNVIVYAKNGEKGSTGNGILNVSAETPQVRDNDTITPITVTYTYTDKPASTFYISAKNGAQGVSVASVSVGTPTQGTGEYEGYTLSPLRINLSNQQYQDIIVYAKNGEGGSVDTSNFVTIDTFQVISANKTFTGSIGFSNRPSVGNSNVALLSDLEGVNGFTKTKITLAQLRSKLALYSQNLGQIVQIVYKGNNSNVTSILNNLGTLYTIYSTSIYKRLGNTGSSQSSISGVNDSLTITSTLAYVNRTSWDYNIDTSTTSTVDGTSVNITDTDFDFYVIGG